MNAELRQIRDALEARGCRPRDVPSGGIKSLCPVCQCGGGHHDPSLSVNVGDKRPAVLFCHGPGKCKADVVIGALGLPRSDALGDGPARGKGRQTARPPASPRPCTPEVGHHNITDTYSYHDAAGHETFRVCRVRAPGQDQNGKPAKSFRQARPDPTSPTGFYWGRGDVRLELYHLPAVLEAVQKGRRVAGPSFQRDDDG